MNVNYFDINIIDTKNNVQVVSLEKTALGSPTLVYNGAENLHQNIMTSQLDFSFWVSELHSTKYQHLFTGSETHYKVELVDVSVYNYPKTIWVGYLLPEQFSEPYKAKDYAVNFTATDGVALLKEKKFSTALDTTDNKLLSVLNVINECLLKVGLSLPIRFSEAIQNSVFELNYLDLEADLNAYLEDGVYTDAFAVLERCVKSLGCKLFQFGGFWYLTGLNKQKLQSVTYKQYVYNTETKVLNFDKEVTLLKEIVTNSFIGEPTITLLPPFKTVSATWDASFKNNLLPEDVVNKQTTAELKQIWRKYSQKDFFISSYYKELLFTDEEANLLEQYKAGTLTKPTGVFDVDKVAEGPFLMLSYDGVQSVYGGATEITNLDSLENYIELKRPVFINGKSDNKLSATLQIELKTVGYNLFLGSDTPIVVDATVFDGVNYHPRRSSEDQVRFFSASHGLVVGDIISIEDEVDENGNVLNNFYSGIYNVIGASQDYFIIGRDYNSNVAYTTKVVQITNFSDIDTVEQSLTDHFNKSGTFSAIDTLGGTINPRIQSNNHGLEVSNFIEIPIKEGYAKRVYDGVHQTIGNTNDTFQLNTSNGDQSYSGEWKILPFKENFLFQIVTNKTVYINDGPFVGELISNYDFSIGRVKGMYDFDITQEGVTVKCTLNLEDIVVPDDAYYNLRLRPVITSDYLSNQVVFTKVAFNLNNQQDVNATLTRAIDYTSLLDVSNFHSCSRLENTDRNFLFSNALQSRFLNGTEAFKSYVAAEDNFIINGNAKQIVFVKQDVERVLAGYKIYQRTIGETTLTEIVDWFLYPLEDDNYGVLYYQSASGSNMAVSLNQEVVLQQPNTLPNANSYHMFKSLFNRVGVAEAIDWQECLAKIYHDLYQKPLVKCVGEIQDLVGPLDIVNLVYNGNKQCTPVNITCNLTEGITQVTIVENATELVNDYE